MYFVCGTNCPTTATLLRPTDLDGRPAPTPACPDQASRPDQARARKISTLFGGHSNRAFTSPFY